MLGDNSIFSRAVFESFKNDALVAAKPVQIEEIIATQLSEIREKINDINKDNSAVFVCGEYYSDNGSKLAKPKEVIDCIKEKTKAPIYTNLIQYVEGGALGGYINIGENVGKVSGELLKAVISRGEINLIVPSYNVFNIPYFNFKAMREYNLNPSSIPQNSIIINKGKIDFLLYKNSKIITWLIILVLIIIISNLLIITIINNNKVKKNKALLEESRKIDKLKNDISMMMSHEFRTPLNIIINSCELLKSRILNNNMEKDFMINTHRLIRLGNNFIDANKFTSKYMNITFTNCNIVEVVEDAVMEVVSVAENHNIEVIFDTEEEEIIMAIDKSKIERIILNLLSNSIKFIGNGNKINVDIYRKEKKVVIKVSDNGIGMNEAMKSNIFEKFQRVENEEVLSREYEGSGLGLYIVKECVKIHSGEIHLESELGKGTTFIIELPIIQVDDSYSQANSNLKHMAQIELSDLDIKRKK